MMHLPIAGIVSGSSGAVVTVSGESISHTEAGAASKAGIRVNADGTIDKRELDTYTQIDSATDWIKPNGSADSTYDVRVTSVTGDAFLSAAAANDVWIDLSADRLWYTYRGSAGTATTTFTLEIRKDGGAVLDSASYTFTATRT